MGRIEELIREGEAALAPVFAAADEIAYENQEKVIRAFEKNRIALRHFAPSTGYGYGDEGRDTLVSLFADIFGAEAGLVSPIWFPVRMRLLLGCSVFCAPAIRFFLFRGIRTIRSLT